MPLDGKIIRQVLREIESPATAEQIARHLQKRYKRSYNVLFQEVTETLFGGKLFGYIKCRKGFYYNIEDNQKIIYEKIKERENAENEGVKETYEKDNPKNKRKRKRSSSSARKVCEVDSKPVSDSNNFGHPAKKRKCNINLPSETQIAKKKRKEVKEVIISGSNYANESNNSVYVSEPYKTSLRQSDNEPLTLDYEESFKNYFGFGETVNCSQKLINNRKNPIVSQSSVSSVKAHVPEISTSKCNSISSDDEFHLLYDDLLLRNRDVLCGIVSQLFLKKSNTKLTTQNESDKSSEDVHKFSHMFSDSYMDSVKYHEVLKKNENKPHLKTNTVDTMSITSESNQLTLLCSQLDSIKYSESVNDEIKTYLNEKTKEIPDNIKTVDKISELKEDQNSIRLKSNSVESPDTLMEKLSSVSSGDEAEQTVSTINTVFLNDKAIDHCISTLDAVEAHNMLSEKSCDIDWMKQTENNVLPSTPTNIGDLSFQRETTSANHNKTLLNEHTKTYKINCNPSCEVENEFPTISTSGASLNTLNNFEPSENDTAFKTRVISLLDSYFDILNNEQVSLLNTANMLRLLLQEMSARRNP